MEQKQASGKTVIVRGVEIGGGIPKICVPLVGEQLEELLEEAALVPGSGADLVEWRADCFQDLDGSLFPGRVLEQLRAALGDIPLLFTFRTSPEGGQRNLPLPQYLDLAREAASGSADLVDLELFTCGDRCREAVEEVRELGAAVVLSSHDFHATPAGDEMVARLRRMADLGGDIAKLAAMPRSPRDVLALLSATLEANQSLPCPVITMSMGGIGCVSRISGGLTGSAVTFGALRRASAPGQLDAASLRGVLDMLSRAGGQ